VTTTKHGKIILPALRGVMGDWVYYSSLMNLKELSDRVTFASELHKSKKLSKMIQRQLQSTRSAQIAKYLQQQKERLFNSLVIATYGGRPNWHAIDSVEQKSKRHELNDLPAETISSVGFLTLHGDEGLFALDGQHRLAGIKKAAGQGLNQDPVDEVSVIFVAHATTKAGLQRTRRLFTTLNKTARPVSKGDIIALDEDDVMAVCVRRLIEDTDLFGDDRIAFVASNNMPVGNTTALTTIGTLYDVLTILFTGARSKLKASRAALNTARPEDRVLDQYFAYARRYFELLSTHFAEMKAFFAATDYGRVTARNRGSHGGNMMFRPIGLEIMTRVIARLTKEMTLEAAVERASMLPRELKQIPYKGLMWDTARQTITNAHKATLREVLLYMLGDYSSRTDADLLKRYRKDSGEATAALPRRIAE
jgi:DNA sulfur modification protein DndB